MVNRGRIFLLFCFIQCPGFAWLFDCPVTGAPLSFMESLWDFFLCCAYSPCSWHLSVCPWRWVFTHPFYFHKYGLHLWSCVSGSFMLRCVTSVFHELWRRHERTFGANVIFGCYLPRVGSSNCNTCPAKELFGKPDKNVLECRLGPPCELHWWSMCSVFWSCIANKRAFKGAEGKCNA